MEWKTPFISEKFHVRFGRHPSPADSGDTGLGTTLSDSAEDFSASSGSSGFQPIRNQVTIPTAHVIPSTAGMSPSRPNMVREPLALKQMNWATSENPDLKAGFKSKTEISVPQVSSTANGIVTNLHSLPVELPNPHTMVLTRLDHSLFSNAEFLNPDDSRKFDMPAIEPTLNQSAMQDTFYADPRIELAKQGVAAEMGKETHFSVDSTYETLLERKNNTSGNHCESQNGIKPTGSTSSGVLLGGINAQSQMWLKEQMSSKGFNVGLPQHSCGLLAWQQKQDFDSLRLQMEQMQLLNGGTPKYPTIYQPNLPQDTSKWDTLIKANENLLKEKEMVIEQQKQLIFQLEHKMRESELRVQNTLIGRNSSYNDIYLFRLQEAQRENTFLRAQFAERIDCFNKERSETEQKLASAEAEVRRLNGSLKECTQKHTEEMKKQEDRIRGRDKHINGLKKKCQKESEQNREKQQRIETLERYLADLPTLEDYKKQSSELKDLEHRCSLLQDTVSDLETKLLEARTKCREKESQLETLKEKESELLTTVHSLQDKVKQCLEDAANLPLTDLDKLKHENHSFKEELERAKKMIEKQQKKMEQVISKIRMLEDQLANEEGTSNALREEIMMKENNIQQLRFAMRELSARNQELIEKNLILQETIGHSESKPQLPEMAQLTRKLHSEMSSCLRELQSLCNILNQRSQGRDPNLSLLLGIRSTQYPMDDQDDWQNVDVLSKKLSDIQHLRNEVEELRTTISDRYAQDMGDNCIAQ
ncbi:centrosomal protein of 85 kDa isoform X1 [Erpetoichthys calabaricus]|uniref:Centrosomal protein 85 n=2 Tax=Erpetoichthys calabaricus TaxID=27687 RepID=A0A8C4XE58_ERPCA|nr:centrosomal protein of 85 kDa isoform X1 [Erpetoichthys calabaricus]